MEDGTGRNRPGQSHARYASRVCSLDTIVERRISTDVGSLVNFQGMYSLNKFLCPG